MSCEECEKIQKLNLQEKSMAFIRIDEANVLVGACDKHFNELRHRLGIPVSPDNVVYRMGIPVGENLDKKKENLLKYGQGFENVLENNTRKTVKCKCGIEFDLAEASWCDHKPIRTKLCPNGHCICHLLKDKHKWRPASKLEKKLGFELMLKEEFGGVKE